MSSMILKYNKKEVTKKEEEDIHNMCDMVRLRCDLATEALKEDSFTRLKRQQDTRRRRREG